MQSLILDDDRVELFVNVREAMNPFCLLCANSNGLIGDVGTIWEYRTTIGVSRLAHGQSAAFLNAVLTNDNGVLVLSNVADVLLPGEDNLLYIIVCQQITRGIIQERVEIYSDSKHKEYLCNNNACVSVTKYKLDAET